MTWCECLPSLEDERNSQRVSSPEFIQNSLSDVSEGRVVSSVMKIEDTGHLVNLS
jgi:hypothetical protein